MENEPWLDSLSEDWTSQPRSSLSTSLPHGTPAGSSKASAISPHPQSRIPRFKVKTGTESPNGSLKVRDPKITAFNSRPALRERSSSEINVPRGHYSSIAARQKSATRSPKRSSSLSPRSSDKPASSTGSVARHVNAGLQSEARQRDREEIIKHTPEWRKLVMRDQTGPGNGQDLFSPLELEGIFKQPKAYSSKLDQSSFSFNELESMPSSPPPWSSNRRSRVSTKHSIAMPSVSRLTGINEEQDEDNHAPKRPTTVATTLEPNDGFIDQDTSLYDSHLPATDRQHEAIHLPDSSGPVNKAVIRNEAATGSSSTDGFSPVYISKHNTVDGKVNYAAMDLSNSSMRNKARCASQQTHQKPNAEDGRERKAQSTAEICGQDSLRPTTRNASESLALPPISSFVNTRRGGLSDDGSFRRRPLSSAEPSSMLHSDSILPSDSASQIHGHIASTIPTLEIFQSDVRGIAPVDALTTPQRGVAAIDDTAPMTSSPLKLFGNHDTFTNNQLLRRMSHLDLSADKKFTQTEEEYTSKIDYSNDRQTVEVSDTASDNAVVFAEPEANADASVVGHAASSLSSQNIALRPEHCATQTTCLFDRDSAGYEGPKRQAPGSNRPPTPKRQRCSSKPTTSGDQEWISHSVATQRNQIDAIIGRKRKDARSDSKPYVFDPALIASRQILRPRNPTPGHGWRDDLTLEHRFMAVGSEISLDVAPSLHRGETLFNSKDAAQIRNLASQAATFRMKSHLMPESSRKQSVSTQDYVDEAMKIMDLIRSKQWNADLEDPEEHEQNHSSQATTDDALTPQTISRSPSRQGLPSAWRTRDGGPVHPRVVSHLKKYEETGDESFLVSSIVRSVKATEQEPSALNHHQEHCCTSPPNPPKGNILIRSHSDSDLGQATFDLADSPIKTHSSTDSSGRTLKSNASQRLRNLPTISPDKISHLIDIEKAGMRFDKEKQTWVRRKEPTRPQKIMEDIASSAVLDDDGLDEIPDLTVDEGEEQERMDSRPKPDQIEDMAYDIGDAPSRFRADWEPSQRHPTSPLHEDFIEPDDIAACLEDIIDTDSSRTIELHVTEKASSTTECVDNKPAKEPTTQESYTHVADAEDSMARPALQRQVEAARSPKRKQRNSVFFSSPPVSHTWNAANHLDLHAFARPHQRPHSLRTLLARPSTRSDSQRVEWQEHEEANVEDSVISYQPTEHQTHQHQEFSMTEIRPDGRTLSFSLSIATPAQKHRAAHAPLVTTSALRTSSFLPSLSPLSNFSVHQDDSHHLRARKLSQSNARLAIQHEQNYVTSAYTSQTLIARLTDAEPDEPYWDWMASLNLERKDLDDLHMLDEFCPRLEELNVGHNGLSQIAGAPSSVRSLHISHNALSSLTHWGAFCNLQYLDVSHNSIESLEGFCHLIHLRELCADHNQIATLDGILDLDGLLSLDLRSNKLKSVDWQGSGLRRLAKLNLSDNQIEYVKGFETLPGLRVLDISKNCLTAFGSPHVSDVPRSKIRCLNLNANCLSSLDISTFPALRRLQADSNSICFIDGLLNHRRLDTVHLRNQNLPSSLLLAIDDFHNIRNLYLSGTPLPAILPIKKRALDLHILDVSCTGVQKLPRTLGSLVPNLRALGLNGNCITDLRPLSGILDLRQLQVADNRVGRLRKLVKILDTLGTTLEELDLRNNPICQGFYPTQALDTRKVENSMVKFGSISKREEELQVTESQEEEGDDDDDSLVLLQRAGTLTKAEEQLVEQHQRRLDEETNMRRKIYEMLLASKCQRLESVDGMSFDRGRVYEQDTVWEKLVELGVVQSVA
ncbi:MAG: hypothetical protein M1828_003946 [Chrysothrix sp. TS-e1954]|nr:MAG: hypothetical protein M1828_003946 [Chrysothrix sp. TS-e1954]